MTSEELMASSSDKLEKIIHSLLCSPCNFTSFWERMLEEERVSERYWRLFATDPRASRRVWYRVRALRKETAASRMLMQLRGDEARENFLSALEQLLEQEKQQTPPRQRPAAYGSPGRHRTGGPGRPPRHWD